MSAQARERRRRHKADPYRKSIPAVSVVIPPNVCDLCGHATMIHRGVVCLTAGCKCGAA
jgi:transposase